MPNPKFNLDERALKKFAAAQAKALEAEINKEIARQKPSNRAGLEKVVKVATGRMKGVEYPKAAQKSIVDQWVKSLGLDR